MSLSGEKNPNWNGGRTLNKSGGKTYVLILTKNHPLCDRHGYVREHRLVMEKHLDRFLTRKEIVYHINGDSMDNRIENLIMFPNSSEHMKSEKEVHKNLIPFGKGHIPFSKGKKIKMNTGRTHFKKGNPPPPHKPNCKCFRCIHK